MNHDDAPLARYRQLTEELGYTRWRHQGHESAEEEALLDQLDLAWEQMTDEERAEADSWPPLETPIAPPTTPPIRTLQDTDDDAIRIRKETA